MDMFEKEFTCQEIIDNCDQHQKISIVWNDSREQRGHFDTFFEQLKSRCDCKEIMLKYASDSNSLVKSDGTIPLDFGIRDILEKLEDVPLIINISTMNLQVMGAMLKQLPRYSFPRVFCMYTEPKRYARYVDQSEDRGYFDLHRRMKGIGPIEGYYNGNVDQRPVKWIPFLGFEGHRAQQIHENYDFADCIPVVTLPSYKPSWQNFILRENIKLLNEVAGGSVQYVQADSFVDAYEKLDELHKAYRKHLLRVSPFGTKINALGILLYALNHGDNIDIVYDNPVEDGAAISEDIGNTHVFDITEFLNQVKKD